MPDTEKGGLFMPGLDRADIEVAELEIDAEPLFVGDERARASHGE